MRIGDVAARTGVSTSTLRAWERRYGLLDPARTSGGHRTYTGYDVARVAHVLRLLENGWSAAAAAARVTSERAGDAPPRPHGRTASLERSHRALWSAVDALDAPTMERVLDELLLGGDVAAALDEVIIPVMRRLGAEWQLDARNIAREHVTSHHVRARLTRLLTTSTGSRVARCLAACPEGEMHDLGTVMASAVLAQAGWDVVVLGAHTPWVSVDAIIRELAPPLLVLGAARRTPAQNLLRAWTPPDDSLVLLGGAGFVPSDVKRLPRGLLHHGPLRDLVGALERAAAAP